MPSIAHLKIDQLLDFIAFGGHDEGYTDDHTNRCILSNGSLKHIVNILKYDRLTLSNG